MVGRFDGGGDVGRREGGGRFPSPIPMGKIELGKSRRAGPRRWRGERGSVYSGGIEPESIGGATDEAMTRGSHLFCSDGLEPKL